MLSTIMIDVVLAGVAFDHSYCSSAMSVNSIV
jgi:hypothetical protein